MKHRVTECLLLSIGILFPALSHAQTLPFDLTGGSGSTAVDFELRLDGSIVEKGYGTSTLTNADLQANSVFIWYSPQSALRAGTYSTETASSIGQGSVAFGLGCFAPGAAGFAAGTGSNASALNAVALGRYDYGGYCSTAIGQNNSATAAWTCAIGGYGNTASSSFATAMGGATLASGVGSTSTGWASVASGEYAATFNFTTAAQAYDSAAFGQFNSGGGNATSWVATDPLFEIGNGTSSSATSDALVVYKNGNTTVQGTLAAHTGVRCAPGGDLSMGTFTAGTAP
jgi:hypothetical protein